MGLTEQLPRCPVNLYREPAPKVMLQRWTGESSAIRTRKDLSLSQAWARHCGRVGANCRTHLPHPVVEHLDRAYLIAADNERPAQLVLEHPSDVHAPDD
jgi:hypothetical protein